MIYLGISFFSQNMVSRAKEMETESWNVLLVSHGGWIREFIGYMLQDNSCSGVPMKRWHDCCPNTGISKFTISIYKEGDINIASADCILFQCKRHLNSMSDSACKCSKCDELL